MTTPWYDLTCEAMREYVAALRDPHCGPARVAAHYEAVKPAMAGLMANLESEMAEPADAAKMAKGTQLIQDATEARLQATRRLGEVMAEIEKSFDKSAE